MPEQRQEKKCLSQIFLRTHKGYNIDNQL